MYSPATSRRWRLGGRALTGDGYPVALAEYGGRRVRGIRTLGLVTHDSCWQGGGTIFAAGDQGLVTELTADTRSYLEDSRLANGLGVVGMNPMRMGGGGFMGRSAKCCRPSSARDRAGRGGPPRQGSAVRTG